jgi:hypothetical protein
MSLATASWRATASPRPEPPVSRLRERSKSVEGAEHRLALSLRDARPRSRTKITRRDAAVDAHLTGAWL